MDIGKEQPAIVVEPIRDPFTRETPDEAPQPEPAPAVPTGPPGKKSRVSRVL